ncbi:MAG: DUF3565 domain-containing protein [Gammaproteobacteria bacterium]|nr:DUF3565 domain-containing protein [Gammaproteobacteria bacterium]
MHRPITGFHLDDGCHWVAQLACGHNQHVSHEPPWNSRPWVVTVCANARERLNCVKCELGAPKDEQP